MEMEDLFKGIKDINGFKDLQNTIKHVKDVPWNGPMPKIPDSPLNKVMGPVSTALDLLTLGKGSVGLGTGISNGDGVEITDGVHDILDGGSGVLGNIPGPVGACMKAFNAGFTVGDYAAPYVFTDPSKDPGYTEAPSEDGEYHAHTGNDTVDGVIDGSRMISNGDYVDGGLEIADSALDTAAMVVPGAGLVKGAVDIGKLLW